MGCPNPATSQWRAERPTSQSQSRANPLCWLSLPGSHRQLLPARRGSSRFEAKFLLYSYRAEQGCLIEPSQEEALKQCPFNASLPLVMIIHGWSVRALVWGEREGGRRACLAATSVCSLHAAGDGELPWGRKSCFPPSPGLEGPHLPRLVLKHGPLPLEGFTRRNMPAAPNDSLKGTAPPQQCHPHGIVAHILLLLRELLQ